MLEMLAETPSMLGRLEPNSVISSMQKPRFKIDQTTFTIRPNDEVRKLGGTDETELLITLGGDDNEENLQVYNHHSKNQEKSNDKMVENLLKQDAKRT